MDQFTFKSTDSLQEALLPPTDSEAEILFSPSITASLSEPGPRLDPLLQSPVTTVLRPFRLGGADLGVPGHPVQNLEEEGMLMGPSHPLFTDPNYCNTKSPTVPISPDLPVPPGARFDPISPVGPSFYSPGDPDFDELLPPGLGTSNSLGKTIRPPSHAKKNDNAFGYPLNPGGPPFFM